MPPVNLRLFDTSPGIPDDAWWFDGPNRIECERLGVDPRDIARDGWAVLSRAQRKAGMDAGYDDHDASSDGTPVTL